MELNERIFIDGNYEVVCDILDHAGYDYDWDSYDRLMCSSEDLYDIISLLEENAINFDVL